MLQKTVFGFVLVLVLGGVIFRGGREGKERERNISVLLLLLCSQLGNLALKAGLCPDWESNP